MNREYHRWYSPRLGRDMELLVHGHAGLPVLVFPTSCGRFFEFEEFGMVRTVADKLWAGHLQFFCVDSVDAESWYNRGVGPDWRIARHVQYESYVIEEVLPLIRAKNGAERLVATGCQLWGIPRGEHCAAAPGSVHGLSVDVRRVRSYEFSGWLQRLELLLQLAAAVSSEPQ